MTLTLDHIQQINRLSFGESDKGSVEIAALLDLNAADVEAVIRGRYVEDVRHQFKADADITLHEYNTIRSRWQPRTSLNSEYALARELLIDPKTVLKIAKSQFSNANTHPTLKPTKAKAVKAKPSRRLFTRDLDEIHRLHRNMWSDKEIAEKLGVAPELVTHARVLEGRELSAAEILTALHEKFGGHDVAARE